ncbi:MAG: 3'(2'),5'-bisphosphate nucleotidase CysQ [Pseudomonadota bacterium]
MDDDLALIVEAARAAGALALDLAKGGVDAWEKSPGNPVTKADIAIDQLLAERLLAARPDHGWLSEERADDPVRLGRRRIFLVDPIDGTRDYARGRPGWCVSIAIVEAGRPTHAVLYAPVSGNAWTATAGGGARCDGESITASSCTALAKARIPVEADLFRSKYWQGPTARSVTKPNSIALRMAMVADARADTVFDARPSRELDIAAASLIVTEAGGIVTDTDGHPARFNKPDPSEKNLVASATPQLHRETCAEAAATIARWRAAQS